MTERMTDERLSAIESYLKKYGIKAWKKSYGAVELIEALKAEREKVKELKADKARLLGGGQYLVCIEHPFLLAISATASALGCPYCAIQQVEKIPDQPSDSECQIYGNEYNIGWSDCHDEIRRALNKKQCEEQKS